MNTWTFILMAALMCASIMFYTHAFIWVMNRASPISQFIVAAASVVFCLIMARCNVDQNMIFTVTFVVVIPFYLWLAIKAFNKMVPTKGKGDE
jgi:hypothetical protein